jgi:transcription antitermination factor NusG
MSSNNNYRWFIIHVFTGQEKVICKYLAEQRKKMKMDDLIDQIIVPERMIKEKIIPWLYSDTC